MADEGLPIGTESGSTEADAVSMFDEWLDPKDTEAADEPEDAASEAAEQETSEEDTPAEDAAEESEEEQEAEEEKDDEPKAESPAPVITLDDGTVLTKAEVEENHRSGLRQADYTRKTQAVAELRKETEAEKAKVSEARQTYAEKITQLESFLSQNVPSTEGLDALRQTDPAEYAARVADLNRQQQQLAAVQVERQRVQAEQAEEAAKQHSQYLAAERDRLLEVVPEWKADPTKAQAELQALRAAGAEYGFSDAELDQVADHRAILLLRDAMRYRQGQKATAQVKPKIAKAPVLKPGTTGRVTAKPVAKQRQSDFERLKKTGHINDATRLLMDFVGDD